MTRSAKPLVIWLSLVCLTIIVMVVVGGITRLTHSGLSMVDWRPLMGIIPPLTEAEWQATFDIYKQFPEYQKVNRHLDLEGFKSIFYWEYGHRILGRLIGLIFFVPFVVFLVLGKIDRQMGLKLLIALLLGGLQGLMGWYMVQSGLIDMPRVSHYRLAAHLLLAFLILG
ncbi:MAG: COX15/CtaA family protein, partial [Pseudomonadales bacterium]